MTPSLEILRLGPLARDPGLLEWLADALARRLALAPRIGPPLDLREEWRARRRGQLSADRVVTALVERDDARPDAGWTLALTDADLFAPRRSFVFGAATRGGNWAVVSTARLHAPVPLLRDRTLKEALHEIGHLAGLGHCRTLDCVMYPAASADDTDRRPAVFCTPCGASFAVSSGLDTKRFSR